MTPGMYAAAAADTGEKMLEFPLFPATDVGASERVQGGGGGGEDKREQKNLYKMSTENIIIYFLMKYIYACRIYYINLFPLFSKCGNGSQKGPNHLSREATREGFVT